jgi:hypothetical protein
MSEIEVLKFDIIVKITKKKYIEIEMLVFGDK